MHVRSSLAPALAGMLSCHLVQSPVHAGASTNPFASRIVHYDSGPSPTPGYTNASAALGSPERFTGEGVFPSVVSPFSPPFMPDELVSISPGGSLTLAFEQPATNDPHNLFGIDLIIFNNAGFIDGGAFPNAMVAGVFGDDGGIIEVSADGVEWRTVPNVLADGLMPTLGYLDSGPYDARPGKIPSDFTRPVDPALTISHFLGLDIQGIRSMYRGSGGGVGIDLDTVGLASVSFVRITLPASAPDNMEIDAVADAAPRRPGDADLDGDTDVDDLILVILNWGRPLPGSPPADFNNDQQVNVDDLIIVILNWGNA